MLLKNKDLPKLSHAAGRAVGRMLRNLREGYQVYDKFAVEHNIPDLQASLQKDVKRLQQVRNELQTFRTPAGFASKMAAGGPMVPSLEDTAALPKDASPSLDSHPPPSGNAPSAKGVASGNREEKPMDAGLKTEQVRSGADFLVAGMVEAEAAANLRKSGIFPDWRTRS